MNTDWTFTTKVDAHCYGIADYFKMPDLDFDTKKPQFTVKWEIQWEARERGLKGAYIAIFGVLGDIEWEVSSMDLTPSEKARLLVDLGGTEYMNETISGSIEFNNPAGWEIVPEFEFAKDGGIMPKQVEIDFITKKITVI